MRCALIDEFPDGFINGFLKRQSVEQPDFPFGQGFDTPLTQTFMMAANAAYKLELSRVQEKEIVLFDRYIDSVIAYQSVVIRNRFTNDAIEKFNSGMKGIFPKTDWIFYFDAKPDLIKGRLQERGLYLEQGFYDFIASVGAEFEKNLSSQENVIRIDASMSKDRVCSFVSTKIEELENRYDHH